jgi:multidrug efflux pump subunit AcrA (membrane-fusion protein)
MQIRTFFGRIYAFFTRKRLLWSVVIILVLFVGWFFFIRKPVNKSIQSAEVVKKDIKKTVLTTGQVVSSTDLNLSFQTSGVVRRINVREGDNVTTGQVLAVLDQGSISASLESAKGSLAQAKANYEKVKASATGEDIAVSAAAVDSAKGALDNAKQDLLNQIKNSYNDANNAVLSTNVLFSNPQTNYPQFGISGVVQTSGQLVSEINSTRVAINNLLSDWQMKVSSLNSDDINSAVSLSQSNLVKVSDYLNSIVNLLSNYSQVSSGGSQTTVSGYITSVSTSKSTVDAGYTTILNDMQAVNTANYSLAQAQASLNLKKAPPRPEDLNIAEAQVIAAQGQYDSVLSNYNNTVIVAPAPGTITQIDVKIGELATAQKEVMKLLNVNELHTEAQVSEADIVSLEIGQTIDNTFDALGPDKHFESKILTINPASTLVSGVVNYKITGGLPQIKEIKPGMTSNMTILVAQKPNVTVVPSGSIVNKDGKKYVRVVDDLKLKTYHEVPIEVGLEGDGGDTEVLSGITVGTNVVTYVK